MGSALIITTNLHVPKSPESLLMDVGASVGGVGPLEMMKLCKKAGVCDLGKFVSESDDDFYETAKMFGLDPEEMTKFDEEWFEPSAGLEAVRGLRAYLLEHPDSIRNSAGIIEDLNDYEVDLVAAESIGAKWHFCVFM
jgi:hypothetical protein